MALPFSPPTFPSLKFFFGERRVRQGHMALLYLLLHHVCLLSVNPYSLFCVSNVINRISKSHAARVHTISQSICFHIAFSDVFFITINQYMPFKDNKAWVVPFGSIIIVNIKKFNYRVHNYNAPPTALRRESVGREDNHVCKKSGE